MVKRFADWLEKVSVAALAVGLFQSIAVVAFGGCMLLTRKMEGTS